MMTRKFGETAPKTANFEASEERFEVPGLQESKRLLLRLASTPLKGPFLYDVRFRIFDPSPCPDIHTNS